MKTFLPLLTLLIGLVVGHSVAEMNAGYRTMTGGLTKNVAQVGVNVPLLEQAVLDTNASLQYRLMSIIQSDLLMAARNAEYLPVQKAEVLGELIERTERSVQAIEANHGDELSALGWRNQMQLIRTAATEAPSREPALQPIHFLRLFGWAPFSPQ